MKTFSQLYIKYVGVVTDTFRHNNAAQFFFFLTRRIFNKLIWDFLHTL